MTQGRRTRKYRPDELVHLLRVGVDEEDEEIYQVVCTKAWVAPLLFAITDDPVTCFICLLRSL